MATILVIEDDVFLCMDLVESLAKAGHNVVDAYNAADACRKFDEKGPFDLVFSDWQYPGTESKNGGAETIRYIRSKNAGIPIRVLTGSDITIQDVSVACGVANLGDVQIIGKPVFNIAAHAKEALLWAKAANSNIPSGYVPSKKAVLAPSL